MNVILNTNINIFAYFGNKGTVYLNMYSLDGIQYFTLIKPSLMSNRQQARLVHGP